jgi:hypothetical protein
MMIHVVRTVMVKDIYILILAMAPLHRPSDVLAVRAGLAVPVWVRLDRLAFGDANMYVYK